VARSPWAGGGRRHCQPNAVLRATTDIHGVRVGNHIAPQSGPKIVEEFDLLLKWIANDALSPWAAHVAYETRTLIPMEMGAPASPCGCGICSRAAS
jgi:hypothetical protein